MKLYTSFSLILILSFLGFGQTRKPAPKPISQPIIATAPTPKTDVTDPAKIPSQKVVVEKSNGDRLTGLFFSGDTDSIVIEVSGAKLPIMISEINSLRFGEAPAQSSATASEQSASVPESTSLSFEAALVYSYGGAQPVARADFILLNKSLTDILRDAGLQPERNLDYPSTFALAMQYGSTNRNYQNFISIAASALKAHMVTQTQSDFAGKGKFENVQPGNYWVLALVKTRRGFAIWNLPVEVKTGSNNVVLDQNNAAAAL